MKRLLCIAAVALSFACGPSGSEGPTNCATTCDCTQTTAEARCPGEWGCVEGTCQYTCKSQCSQEPFTCASSDTCNGSICSSRTGC